jgi:hypothetical protein
MHVCNEQKRLISQVRGNKPTGCLCSKIIPQLSCKVPLFYVMMFSRLYKFIINVADKRMPEFARPFWNYDAGPKTIFFVSNAHAYDFY